MKKLITVFALTVLSITAHAQVGYEYQEVKDFYLSLVENSKGKFTETEKYVRAAYESSKYVKLEYAYFENGKDKPCTKTEVVVSAADGPALLLSFMKSNDWVEDENGGLVYYSIAQGLKAEFNVTENIVSVVKTPLK